ncbi:ABC transporter ATP-binding protein [Methanohalobium sp.]|uniref:ABC transporter ATP-binding protein n=1 Tax=Methanohalobium sp. TaxID=2837493 RepID=UPI0025DD462E|nr:ATP-binding cassette domain-containing protein [Methanohalobium sp.]
MPSRKLFDRIDSIQLENITKKYNNSFAVQDLNLEIHGGELLILIGPSGSGKTTTLRMINQLIEPDEGRIFINNQDIMQFDSVKLRRNIGYVIQDIGLFPHMTIRNNIGLIPKLEGWSNNEITDKVKTLLDFVSLPPDQFLHRYPNQLSGGQQQRVGLARALAMNPPLLLMDEPFGALDPILRRQLQDEFCRIKQELGRTIVFVTHDIEEAFKLGDRIAIMDGANLIQIGKPEDLIFNPVNGLVSDIVDSNHKFKHMDTLNVKDLMSPMDDKYIFGGNIMVSDAVTRMTDNNIELGLVYDGSDFMGTVEMVNLLKYEGDEKLQDVAQLSTTFSPMHSVSLALSELKNKNESFAVVFNGDTPKGLLLSNEVFLKLI